jgi:hypothetical protein
MIKLGIIGLSEGNGHPFSFAAIINGYSDPGLRESGWPVIYEYVRRRDRSEFGIEDLRVTHAWTQDPEQTGRLCAACLIPHAVSRAEEMVGQVDAIILARDDYENHYSMAMPFLKAGLPVFVDKPLSLSSEELKGFRPYLESGKLMSCSAMRYARELDEPRATLEAYGKVRLIRGAVLNSWEKYGVHLLDAIFGIYKANASHIVAFEADHSSIGITMDNGSLVQIDCLGEVPKTFRVDIWGDKGSSGHDIFDNFTMFRRMLWHFGWSIKNRKPAFDPEKTIDSMRILMAGKIARNENRKVMLNEIQL